MNGAARRSWLVMGFSPGEMLCVFGLLGVLTAIAASSVPAILAHVTQTEALQLTLRPRVYWVERWANDGRGVASAAPAGVYEVDGLYSALAPDDAGDGTITVVFKRGHPQLAGQAITLRPAFSDRDAPFSIAWTCAAAGAPSGFTAVGADRTTIPNEQLITSCRKRT